MSETNSRISAKSPLLKVYAMGGTQIGNAPAVISDKNSGEEWVRFGRYNLFPEFCRGLADNCAPLNACIETMAQYIAGNGLEFLDLSGKPLDAARKKWEELCGEEGEDALLEATALDLALTNTMSWQVIRSRIGIQEVAHLDVSRLRCEKKKEGVIQGYYWSSNWSKYKDAAYKPERIAAWGTEGEYKVVMYRRAYKQQRDYYGEPHWIAAMADAEVLVRIPVFNRTQIETGFKPAIHAHLVTQREAADLAELDENFEMTFTGENGKPYVLTVGAANEVLTITKLERGDHAGELDKTRAVSKEEIYHSYGIPPILMGVNVNTGMSGRGLAIAEELDLFDTTKVKPKQKHIAACAKRILAECGIDVPVVRVKTLVPFEPAEDPALTRQTYLRRVTVGEDRMKAGLPVWTTDGGDAKEDRSNWDQWMLKPLIEVGMKANTNEEQDANAQTNEDDA